MIKKIVEGDFLIGRCRDCGKLFFDSALSDGQCFLCWVKEVESEENYG